MRSSCSSSRRRSAPRCRRARCVRFGSDSTVDREQGRTASSISLDERPIITGEYLTDAKPNQSPLEGTIVEFTLNNEGGRRFQRETAKHVHDYMAIVLDKVVMGVPPVINSAIGTRGQITMGGKDLQAAQDLALVLKAGALPVPLRSPKCATSVRASVRTRSTRRSRPVRSPSCSSS